MLVFALFGLLGTAIAAQPVITIAEARARFSRRENQTPVRVRGVVTFSNQRLGLAYVQDASGGIGFDPRSPHAAEIVPGQTLEVEGYLGRRQGLVLLLRDRVDFGPAAVDVIPGEKKLPPALPFDLDQATQMRIDGLLTRTTGVVRHVLVPPVEGAPMIVEVSTPSGYAIARLPWRKSREELDQWLDTPVTFQAVLICRADPPLLAEDATALLLVSSPAHWTPQRRGLDSVFQRPPITASSAVQATQRANVKQRIHIVGTVTAARSRDWVCLRTDDGSLEVSTRQFAHFAPGQKLSVAAWPKLEDGRLLLQDGVCRVISQEAQPPPLPLAPDYYNPAKQRELVEVAGILHSHTLPGGPPRFTLALANGQACHLAWQTFLQPAQVEHLVPGSKVRVTGICHLHPAGPDAPPNEDGVRLTLHPRSLVDVQVVRGPPWWNRERLTLAVWTLLGLAGLALPGAMIFRWQLWRQARRIREIESHSAAEEERRRIAREFHDSLQQQLTSAALHLETLKGALHAAPDMLPRLIDDTTAMLRHCQVEARHCIWDLRNDSPHRNSLAHSIQDWLENRVPSTVRQRIHFTHQGEEPSMPEGLSLQLMRVTQEAVQNALTHASASDIRISLHYLPASPQGLPPRLELNVEDNGIGFDPGLLHHPRPGHYGLAGIQERAAKIRARFTLTTRPGEGARLTLRLPLPATAHATHV